MCWDVTDSSHPQESAANKGRGQTLDVINDIHDGPICRRGCRRERIETKLRISFNKDVSPSLRNG